MLFFYIFAPQVTLPEHTPPGSAIVTLTATDRDSGDNGKITYRVMSSTQEGFYIDPNNGRLGCIFSFKFPILTESIYCSLHL